VQLTILERPTRAEEGAEDGGKKMNRPRVLICIAAATVLAVGLIIFIASNDTPVNAPPRLYTYQIINTYPHDELAFTEGLVFDNGALYESTGLYGESTLRRVDLETGHILQLYTLPDQFFGEGITIFENRIVQLTWQSHRGFVSDKNSFDLIQEFNYTTEGWGITNDGDRLIMSDGTATLYFLNPENFEVIGHIEITDNGHSVTMLNELEYIHGEIYANIWQTENIAIINPQTGRVTGWVDLRGIRDMVDQGAGWADVLNGIAYDAAGNRLFITGKLWSKLFQIELIPLGGSND
jgi:glutamine cyclotransferase